MTVLDAAVGLCRACAHPLRASVVDLGHQPLANSFLRPEDGDGPEPTYPLHAYLCERCWLMQLQEVVEPVAIFTDYAYFSSYSSSWLAHARRYAEDMVERLDLGPQHQVVELASNDGYLLRNFVERGIPVLGVEPAANVADEAIRQGIPTEKTFFGTETAHRLVRGGTRADLLVGNNVLAHVPAINDFVAGMRALLAPQGVLTMEFPHLLRLVQERQFDTIYHEHFSYFSMLAVRAAFARHRLAVFDVDELPTHGGSLRIYAGHAGAHSQSGSVDDLEARERQAGLDRLETYTRFAREVEDVRAGLVDFLHQAKSEGSSVAAYGAPAKGSTLLNYCGITPELVAFTVDVSPHKQGLLLPGSRLPIRPPDHLFEARPDYLLVLPWNLRDEICSQMAGIRAWGGRFVLAIPSLTVF